MEATGRFYRWDHMPGGWLLVEVGGEQDDHLAPTLRAAGFAAAEPWRDDDGDLRGLAARRS